LHLILVGVSHHQTPIEVRERLSCADHALPDALTALAACSGVREAALLSTCNRMEAYAIVEGEAVGTAYSVVRRHLAEFHQVSETVFAPYLYCKAEGEAVQHLMRVASGLDSLVLGEAQILGQVRTALRAGLEAETVGSGLNALFQQALLTGKRVQSETGLGRGAFSIGHAAVDLARSIFDDLSHASVLMLGAGKMSELTARHLVENGVRFVVVANRTYAKAEEMAARFGGKAIQYDTFPEALVNADIVLSSTAAPHPILRRETLLPVLRRRRGRPLFLIDIAVPRDVAAEVAELDNVFLYNIDDLQAVVAEEARGRAAEAARAEIIASEETGRFLTWYRSREVSPVIAQMRARLEAIRQEDVRLLRKQLGHLSEREWEAVEAATRAMMNKVAREPILRLKRETEEAETQYDLASAARALFGLEEGEEKGKGKKEAGEEGESPTPGHLNTRTPDYQNTDYQPPTTSHQPPYPIEAEVTR
jgi:glutamyl-tRNA reductase